MRTVVLLAAAALLVMGSANVHAQCTINSPAKAASFKTSFVRAYVSCPSDIIPAPNSQTGDGTPSCAAAYVYSPYLFDTAKGSCSSSTKAKKEAPCSVGAAPTCMNMLTSTKCSGILKPNGIDPIDASDTNWALRATTRATIVDPANGGMTIIDFPATVQFSTPQGGAMSLKTSSNQTMTDLGLDPLPGCTQVELVDLVISDPLGNEFARIGLGTR